MVQTLCKEGEAILKTMTAWRAELLHMAVGVSSEAGELLDAVKKDTIYNKPLDVENVTEELGDIEFFLEGVRQLTGITREESLEHNMKKLAERYGECYQYTDQKAHDRADKK